MFMRPVFSTLGKLFGYLPAGALFEKIPAIRSLHGNIVLFHTHITERTPELLRLFIRKTVVHEKSTKWSKQAMQTMETHYSGIGCIEEDAQQDKKSPRQEIST